MQRRKPDDIRKTAALAFRIPAALKASIEELARADHRSVASYVEKVLAEHCDPQRRRKIESQEELREYIDQRVRANFHADLSKKARELGFDSIADMLDGKSKPRKPQHNP